MMGKPPKDPKLELFRRRIKAPLASVQGGLSGMTKLATADPVKTKVADVSAKFDAVLKATDPPEPKEKEIETTPRVRKPPFDTMVDAIKEALLPLEELTKSVAPPPPAETPPVSDEPGSDTPAGVPAVPPAAPGTPPAAAGQPPARTSSVPRSSAGRAPAPPTPPAAAPSAPAPSNPPPAGAGEAVTDRNTDLLPRRIVWTCDDIPRQQSHGNCRVRPKPARQAYDCWVCRAGREAFARLVTRP